MNYKDIGIRALKTFIQAFIPVMIVALSTVDVTDLSASKSVLYSALISACSAGLSAVWNLATQLINKPTDSILVIEDEDDEVVVDDD